MGHNAKPNEHVMVKGYWIVSAAGAFGTLVLSPSKALIASAVRTRIWYPLSIVFVPVFRGLLIPCRIVSHGFRRPKDRLAPLVPSHTDSLSEPLGAQPHLGVLPMLIALLSGIGAFD